MINEELTGISQELQAMSYTVIGLGYRIDLLVEDKLVVELKTVENYTSVHFAQILTYLKLGNYTLGLLINYNSKILKNNIKRFINTAPNS